MRKIFNFIVKSRIFFLIFWSVVLVASVVLIFNVNINYDTTLYLSKDSETREALIVMEKEFGLNGQANVMVKVSDVKEALQVKKRLAETDGVLEILWLDTLIGEDEIKTTASIIDFISSLDIDLFDFKQFYNKDTGHALYQVLFEEDQYSLKTGKSIEALRDKLDHNLGKKDNYAMSGPAISTYHTQKLTSDEVFKITLYVIPIILIILIIFTNSWAEPLLFIIVVGASVLINMGTNALFNLFGNQSISFLTNSTASLLQLAITMDYAIFLLHRFRKEKENGLPPKEALSKALYHSFLPINSSMLTTAAGFAALMFMSYTIGFDLAIVMIKGILLSIIITFTLMPSLIMLFDKLLVKTEHKPFFPSLKKLTTPIYKIRFVLPILAALIVLPVFQKQTENRFVYGESAMSASEGSIAALEIQAIEDRFGKNNMVVLLVPKVDNELGITGITSDDEKDLAEQLTVDLKAAGYNASVQSYEAMPDIIKMFVPEDMKKQLIGKENFNRMIITVDTSEESDRAFDAIDLIDKAAYVTYGKNYYLVGSSAAVKEIKQDVEKDFWLVNLLSIGLVLLILLISFRSLIVPIILVVVIELSVWINMTIPALTGSPLIFIGYIIVSSVQLGATIDYGILLTQNYLNARKVMNKKQAFKYSIINSGPSILTSGLILASAGYALKMLSSIEGVSGLGELIGRGALLSTIFVLFLLPQLLYIFDRLIAKTTRKAGFLIEREDATLKLDASEDLTFTVETKLENVYSLEVNHMLEKYLPPFKLFASVETPTEDLETKETLENDFGIIVEYTFNKWIITFKKDGKAYNNILKYANGRLSLFYSIKSFKEDGDDQFLITEIERAKHINIYKVQLLDEVVTVFEEGTLVPPEDLSVDEGFSFDGWLYENKDFDFNSPIKENMKLKPNIKKIIKNTLE